MTVTTKPTALNASALEVHATQNPKPVPSPDAPELAALETFTDHMITVKWSASQGWENPKLVPFAPLPLYPSTSVFQYATACYEGMKVFRGFDGRLRLFRPSYNCHRMLASATRISLPTFDPAELEKLIVKYCALEAPRWLPKDRVGNALYVRPTMIATDSSIGFTIPRKALLCIFMVYWPAPIISQNPTEKTGAKLITSGQSSVRAWPGGTGAAKISANYGPALFEHGIAKQQGYDQVLWLYGADRQVTEAGSTNFFAIFKKAENEFEIATPPIDGDSLILAGGTRRSIIELSNVLFGPNGTAAGVERCTTTERVITMGEIEKAADDGRLVAAFVVGTAFWVQSVQEINSAGKIIKLEVERPHIRMLRDMLAGIMYGKEPSKWPVIVDEAA